MDPISDATPAVIVRRAARAILFDDDGRLVLIKRTPHDRPDDPYWVTPGGGVEPEDTSLEATCLRELHEELGATARLLGVVFFYARPKPGGFSLHHYFLARLESMDLSLRHGPEFADASRGSYDVDRIELHDDAAALDTITLVPDGLTAFLRANRVALLAEAGLLS